MSAQPATPVSDAQLGLIAGLLNDLHTTADAAAIDALGQRFGLAQLSTLRSKERLREQALTRLNASKLIDALKAISPAPSRGLAPRSITTEAWRHAEQFPQFRASFGEGSHHAYSPEGAAAWHEALRRRHKRAGLGRVPRRRADRQRVRV